MMPPKWNPSLYSHKYQSSPRGRRDKRRRREEAGWKLEARNALAGKCVMSWKGIVEGGATAEK